jgi:hypothetical protein
VISGLRSKLSVGVRTLSKSLTLIGNKRGLTMVVGSPRPTIEKGETRVQAQLDQFYGPPRICPF